jgi:hypothetical protein
VESELVVWDTGNTSMIVFNLAKNTYDLDRHDIVLSDDQCGEMLFSIFDLLADQR